MLNLLELMVLAEMAEIMLSDGTDCDCEENLYERMMDVLDELSEEDEPCDCPLCLADRDWDEDECDDCDECDCCEWFDGEGEEDEYELERLEGVADVILALDSVDGELTYDFIHTPNYSDFDAYQAIIRGLANIMVDFYGDANGFELFAAELIFAQAFDQAEAKWLRLTERTN